MATFRALLQEELKKRTGELQPAAKAADPFDPGHDFAQAERWVVNLHRSFQDLARLVAERPPKDHICVVSGAWGSGKTLLVRLFHDAASKDKSVGGAIADAAEILRFTEDEGSPFEDRVIEWKSLHTAQRLQYLIIDGSPWAQVVAGRLRQLSASFPNDPPAVMHVMDFIALRDLEAQQNIRNRLHVVRIPPYRDADLLDLWRLHFASITIDEASLAAVAQRALGNPRLLLIMGGLIAKELRERHVTAATSKLLNHVWTSHGFEAGLKIRNGETVERRGPDLKQNTRLSVLLRVAQRSTGRPDSAGGITATELAREQQLDRSLCSYHLSQLEKDGLAFSYRQGAQVNYATWGPVRVALENFVVMSYD